MVFCSQQDGNIGKRRGFHTIDLCTKVLVRLLVHAPSNPYIEIITYVFNICGINRERINVI